MKYDYFCQTETANYIELYLRILRDISQMIKLSFIGLLLETATY